MIKERLIQVIEFKEIGKEDFYKKIGMTSASFRGKSKKSSLNSDAIERILSEIPDLNPYWLLTGSGNMLKSADFSIAKEPPEGYKSEKVSGMEKEIEALKAEIETLKSHNTTLQDYNQFLKQQLGAENRPAKKAN